MHSVSGVICGPRGSLKYLGGVWGRSDNRSEGVMNHKNKVLSGGDDGLVALELNNGHGCRLDKHTCMMRESNRR